MSVRVSVCVCVCVCVCDVSASRHLDVLMILRPLARLDTVLRQQTHLLKHPKQSALCSGIASTLHYSQLITTLRIDQRQRDRDTGQTTTHHTRTRRGGHKRDDDTVQAKTNTQNSPPCAVALRQLCTSQLITPYTAHRSASTRPRHGTDHNTAHAHKTWRPQTTHPRHNTDP